MFLFNIAVSKTHTENKIGDVAAHIGARDTLTHHMQKVKKGLVSC